MSRHAGVILPLFSAPASTSWGIGEFADLVPLARWLRAGGFDRLMLLPLGTMANGESSPYAAMSTMALDPIYLAVDLVDDFQRAGGPAALSAEARRDLAFARRAGSVAYAAVRRVKREALDLAFGRFAADEWSLLTPRAADLAVYIARERWWLDDYALYQALAESTTMSVWRNWAPPVRDRDPAALDDARRRLSREVLRHQYWQWLAERQWQDARERARATGLRVLGDLTFMVGADSPDVWVRPNEVRFDVSLGAPPDAFSESGQDWGLPTYRWDAIAATDYAWMRQRARRMAALFDGYRVDHLVGLYRTYGRPQHGEPFFTPATESAQIQQGEHLLRILLGSGAAVIAEDLGLVPDFVRASLARLGVPGSKVLRWERAWHDRGQPFLDPARYPVVSAAMTGTHDTETLAAWWDEASPIDRQALLELPSMHEARASVTDQRWSDALRDAMLTTMYRSASEELFFVFQDLFGWRDRINTPGTVSDRNWTWQLPWPVNRLGEVQEARERAAFGRYLAQATGRSA